MEIRELKDAEHIVNVTLKNNRSIETFKQFIRCIVDFYDKIIAQYLEKCGEVPKTPIERLNKFRELISNPEINEYLEEYLTLRKCLRVESVVINEYRRNVEVIFKIDDKEIRLNQKDLKEILNRAKRFYELVQSLC